MKSLRYLVSIVGCALLLLGMGVEVSGQTSRPTRKAKVAPRSVGAETIIGLPWYGSFDEAVLANVGAKNKKPIFYLRVLGDLKGKT